ncbi:MAG: serine hydrolase [Armatimonadetes bacterium]|nr:serine hydrolase [Armatimonadota bacterium]
MSLNHKLAALQRRFSGLFGVAARDLASGREIVRNADEVYPAASCIKVPIMVEVLRQVDAGLLNLGAPLPYRPEHRVAGSGVLKELTPGMTLTVRDAVVLMIIVSDNTATNLLIEAVGGVAPVNEAMRRLSAPQLILHRTISLDDDRPLAHGTPRAFCDLLTRLARGEVVSAAASQTMIEIMKRQQYTDIIGRHLPYDGSRLEEDPEGQLAIASKSGSLRGVRNDVGIVFPPGRAPYVVALMSRDCADDRFWADNEAKLALARVSRIVYEAFVGAEDPERRPIRGRTSRSGHSQGEE